MTERRGVFTFNPADDERCHGCRRYAYDTGESQHLCYWPSNEAGDPDLLDDGKRSPKCIAAEREHAALVEAAQVLLDNHADEYCDDFLNPIRAAEDARMRIGKVLQYADDGVSILDKVPDTQPARDE